MHGVRIDNLLIYGPYMTLLFKQTTRSRARPFCPPRLGFLFLLLSYFLFFLMGPNSHTYAIVKNTFTRASPAATQNYTDSAGHDDDDRVLFACTVCIVCTHDYYDVPCPKVSTNRPVRPKNTRTRYVYRTIFVVRDEHCEICLRCFIKINKICLTYFSVLRLISKELGHALFM